jgi:hypothetical protein
MHDHAGADEADAADDRGGDLSRVVIVRSERVGHHRERRGAEGHQGHRLEAGVLLAPLALDSDDGAEREGERQPDQDRRQLDHCRDICGTPSQKPAGYIT